MHDLYYAYLFRNFCGRPCYYLLYLLFSQFVMVGLRTVWRGEVTNNGSQLRYDICRKYVYASVLLQSIMGRDVANVLQNQPIILFCTAF